MESLKRVWHGFTRSMKLMLDPELRRNTRQFFEQMRKDGVDPSDSVARQEWIRAHRRDLSELQKRRPAANIPTIRAETKTGRNAPCPCGSGRKHKKCCMVEKGQ